MTIGGWILLSMSVGGVTALFFWCMWKSLTTPGESDKMHGFEVETPDEKEQHDRQGRDV